MGRIRGVGSPPHVRSLGGEVIASLGPEQEEDTAVSLWRATRLSPRRERKAPPCLDQGRKHPIPPSRRHKE
ncbi:hypothetical protein B296_00028456 [Ensete ventricosum]|uniref:Uncharacterized protein n=1 Tax=Ensete ventricosum TaxID=4639 RepID=A0A427AMS9_ENSVE|nr:hypothetical protein B296_00028456 [Ensete ventricosum]